MESIDRDAIAPPIPSADPSKRSDAVKDKVAQPDAKDAAKSPDGGWRETIESILMAIVLALLFRGFVAEAFVIPTGSMAPTLMGRHKDIQCPKCNGSHWYQVSASAEVDRNGGYTGLHVVSGTCPTCRYTANLDPYGQPNEGSFSGDRIIVSKFIYDFQDPKRWDVIVFKYPGDATQNYIKRLIGLPGETVTITGGNIYIRPTNGSLDDGFIARKPPTKLNTLLQLVDDTAYLPEELIKVGWPSRWQEWREGAATPSETPGGAAWTTDDGGRSFVGKGSGGEVNWLRYRHLVPSYDDWLTIVRDNRLPDGVVEWGGQLITDFYAYNSYRTVDQYRNAVSGVLHPNSYPSIDYDRTSTGPGLAPQPYLLGMHWVDDLAVECNATVENQDGALWLDVIRGGIHHRCRINIADGVATLTRIGPEGPLPFTGDDGKSVNEVRANTSVKGPGDYQLRLSNCDHEVLLWVNGKVVSFDGPTTYDSDEVIRPVWSQTDPGDLAPAGVGVEGGAVQVENLRIYRDKYYIAIAGGINDDNDYLSVDRGPNNQSAEAETVLRIYGEPESWSTTPLFAPENRRYVTFELQEDQFFPLGDNSPQSQDARLWSGVPPFPPPYVHRELLIGKALMIYWPHTWNRPIPFWPNFRRMGLIH
jgi:signal peptidase I